MGPSGAHALLVESYTRRFDVLQLQYLETAFERVADETDLALTSITNYFKPGLLPSFGKFSDKEGYGGRVPSDRYLTTMLERAVEAEEADAAQHTSLLPVDLLALNDSYKVGF